MADVIRILNGDGHYPHCVEANCRMLAMDGYCEATCCVGYQPRRAYCSEHSHRPTRVLEILGHHPTQSSFTRAEVRRLVMALWAGAGLVYESAGKFEMERDLEQTRATAAQREQHREMIDLMSSDDGSVGKVDA